MEMELVIAKNISRNALHTLVLIYFHFNSMYIIEM